MRAVLAGGKRLFFCTLSVCFLLLAPSCQTRNNDRSIQELAGYMMSHVGGTVSCEMHPVPVKADSGIALMIEGREVAFYKYDTKSRKQDRKLRRIKETKTLYISGIRFDAEVNGSFVMIDHTTNLKKEELIKAFRSF